MGSKTVASGDYSTAMGHDTKASGYYSTAMGYNTEASGKYSTAMGYGTSGKPCIAEAEGEFRACVSDAVFEIDGEEISVSQIKAALCSLDNTFEFC